MDIKITFLGAAGTVTGSRFLLEIQGKKILIDCGLFQGLKANRLKNWESFPVAPSTIDAVALTHAHIDHSGYLPKLCREGFKGDIFCTHATYELCKILLPDSAYLQEEDARWANKKGFSKHKPALPLYNAEDAQRCLKHFKPFYYGDDILITDNTRIKLKDAGHILGSAFIDIKTTENGKTKRILFTGDLGSPRRSVMNDPVQAYEVDYLVLESTYGNRLHKTDDTPKDIELARIINECSSTGGMLIIPSFAVERAQEILFHITDLEYKKLIPPLPVFLDSPMAINATEVFEKMQNQYNLQTRVLVIEGKKILRPQNIKFTKDVNQAKKLHFVKGPGIIISASGMLEGGRILHHLKHRLPDPKNTLLFIGYQAEGTRGKAILNGQDEIKIHGGYVPVNAKVESIQGFSGHADYNEILAWLMGFNRPPEKTFIVHGESGASRSLSEKITKTFGWNVEIPKEGEIKSC